MGKKDAEPDLIEEHLEVAGEVSEDLFSYIRAIATERGDEFAIDVANAVLRNLIATMIINALRFPAPKKNKDGKLETIEEASFNSYMEQKIQVQNCVASAFEVAVTDFSGKDTTYYCDIMPVGDPINKLAV